MINQICCIGGTVLCCAGVFSLHNVGLDPRIWLAVLKPALIVAVPVAVVCALKFYLYDVEAIRETVRAEVLEEYGISTNESESYRTRTGQRLTVVTGSNSND